MAEPSASESSAGTDSDQDFDPTAEMLVNDFDDEHTMEEEEALESAESVSNELDDLQKEGEMPLEELLAIYGYSSKTTDSVEDKQESSRDESSQQELSSDADETQPAVPLIYEPVQEEPAVAPEIIENINTTSSHLLRSGSHASETSTSASDDEYSPDDDWRKTIQVGSDFQAVVPEGLCKYDDAPAYENEDRLLWDPTKLTDEEVVEYLQHAQQSSSGAQGVHAIPVGSHIRDDEQALYLLLQCGHNVEEALRRRRMQPVPPTDTMSLWSEEECRSFENGLRTYGKDFHLIQQHKVRTRSVGELVQFYYLWKKTERHDVFASKTRIEKKKYALHPGTTDYMDRFLDEQENAHRDRSSSPSMQSLIYGDPKRQAMRTSASSPTTHLTKVEFATNEAPASINSDTGILPANIGDLVLPSVEKASNGVSPLSGDNGSSSCFSLVLPDCERSFINGAKQENVGSCVPKVIENLLEQLPQMDTSQPELALHMNPTRSAQLSQLQDPLSCALPSSQLPLPSKPLHLPDEVRNEQVTPLK